MSIEQTRAVMTAYWSGHEDEMVAEDGVLILMATGEETHGREEVVALIREFYSGIFDGSFESTGSFIADGHAAAEGFLVGKHIGDYAGIAATGKDVRVPMCIIYDVSEGLVQRIRVYFETAVLRK